MTTNIAPTISPVQQIESFYARLEKARIITASGKVHPIVGLDEHYVVESSNGDFYLVNGTCTCVDAQQRTDLHHDWCKHKLAVELCKETHKADTPKVTRKARTASPESDAELEAKVADLYR